jgi:hypothetical protein
MDLLRGFFGWYAGLLTYVAAFLRPLLPLVSPTHLPAEINLNGRRLKVLKQVIIKFALEVILPAALQPPLMNVKWWELP